MANSYVVDTHALIWYLSAGQLLGQRAKAAMDEADCVLYLPARALAEACWRVEHNRTNIADPNDLILALDRDKRILVVPLDRAIVELTNSLKRVGEMHDRQIVATAVHLATGGLTVAILTKDADISASGAAPVIW